MILNPMNWLNRRGEGRSRRVLLDYFAVLLLLVPSASLRAADNALSEAEARDGWLLLFDGATTNGWMTSDGKPGRTAVEQGSLQPHKSGHYMLVHTQDRKSVV